MKKVATGFENWNAAGLRMLLMLPLKLLREPLTLSELLSQVEA